MVAVDRLATTIKKLMAKQAVFAERVDACRAQPKQAGSPEDYLARLNGTSRGEAKKAIDTARRLKSCPATADAFAKGELSLGEADAISGAAAIDPTAELELIERATNCHDLADTKDRAAKVRAAAHNGESPADRRKRLAAKRRWSEFQEDEMTAVAGRFLPEQWAAVSPIIDAYAKPIIDQARVDGIRDPFEAYRADAVLAGLAAAGALVGLQRPTPAPVATPTTAAHAESTETAAPVAESNDPEPEVRDRAGRPVEGAAGTGEVEHVDPGRCHRPATGLATATETCEIVGVGPVNIDFVRQILPDALVDVLVHDLVDIKAHATMTRHQKRALESALKVRDRRCVVPGCKRRRQTPGRPPPRLRQTGPHLGQNCELLCEVHHAEKTHRGGRHRTHRHRMALVPTGPAARPTPTAARVVPWRAPIGEHLTAFDLTDLHHPTTRPPRAADGTLPFD